MRVDGKPGKATLNGRWRSWDAAMVIKRMNGPAPSADGPGIAPPLVAGAELNPPYIFRLALPDKRVKDDMLQKHGAAIYYRFAFGCLIARLNFVLCCGYLFPEEAP
jgi:hypothetical protein